MSPIKEYLGYHCHLPGPDGWCAFTSAPTWIVALGFAISIVCGGVSAYGLERAFPTYSPPEPRWVIAPVIGIPLGFLALLLPLVL